LKSVNFGDLVNLRAESWADPARAPSASATERRQTESDLELVTREHALDRERLPREKEFGHVPRSTPVSLIFGDGSLIAPARARALEVPEPPPGSGDPGYIRVEPKQALSPRPALSTPNETAPTVDRPHFSSRVQRYLYQLEEEEIGIDTLFAD
jgi:hypothetical protein